MKSIWCNALTAAGDRTGGGSIHVTSATVSHVLDGSGQLRFDCPVDVRARTLLRAGRYVQIYIEQDDNTLTLLAEGIVKGARTDGSRLSIDAADLLQELAWRITLPNLTLNTTVLAAMSSLTSAYGWTIEASGGALTDDVSELIEEPETVLAALLRVAEHTGSHIRMSTRGGRVIEAGDFGQASGITLVDQTGGYQGGATYGVVEGRLSVEEQADKLTNWILPVGADGVTIALSTRPEKKSTIGPDSNFVYYVSDEASIAEYGLRQTYLVMPELKAVSSAPADQIALANQIVAAAVAELERRSVIRLNFRGKVRGLKTFLKPGDTVQVIYNEPIYLDDGSIWSGGNLNTHLYVIRADVYAGDGGTWQTVELSNINALREDVVTEIVEAVERSKKLA